MKKHLICSLLFAVLAAGLWSCLPPITPAPLSDGSCPGRFNNYRSDKVWPKFFRLDGQTEQFQLGLEIPARTSLSISLPAGHYRVVTEDNAENLLGSNEIFVAVEGGALCEFRAPELGVTEKETLYWWVGTEAPPK